MKPSAFRALRERALKALAEAPMDKERWGTDVATLLEELSVYHIELEHQVEELRQAQEELMALRDGWEDLFQNAPLSYVLMDDDLHIMKYNNPFAKLFARPDIVQALDDQIFLFPRLVSPSSQDAFFRFVRLLRAGSGTAQMECVMLNRYGKNTPVKINAVSKVDQQSIRFAISDMTIQKQLEARLQEKIKIEEEGD